MTHQPMLRDLPEEDRPRERMKHAGAEALSLVELLAILLRTGTKNESALLVAQRILNHTGSLHNLADMTFAELTAIKGNGTAKALELLACLELGRRMAKTRMEEQALIRRPQDAAMLVMESMRYYKREHFVCLFLNIKNKVLAQETISIGTLDASLVHPREVFRAAIRHGCAAVICIHNHPSGDPTPSHEDIAITRRLMEAGELVGIEVLDHIVIGDKRYVSLKEQGHM